MGTKGNNG